MILRHAKNANVAQSIEDTFEAIEPQSGTSLGRCEILVQENAGLFPSRPLRIYLDLEGSPVPDAVIGAAVARAKEIVSARKLPARIFTQAEPEDAALLVALTPFGFKDSDGLILMERPCRNAAQPELPHGCVEVHDDLDDPLEQKFFLERYNRLFGEEHDYDWLDAFRAQPDFKRLMIVSAAGMVCEAAICVRDGVGQLLWLHTSKKWRRKGTALQMVDLACIELQKHGVRTLQAEVQARIPGLLHAMEAAGFAQEKLLKRYPGFDVN